MRRSYRLYEASGPLTLQRADTVETALDYLSKLIVLHDITWKARGKAGAFATPAVRRFHHALIARGVPGGEVDLLRVTAGPMLVGYLMNFRHNGQVSAYQSGFNYSAASSHQKPGLTCHHLAIEAYRAAGAVTLRFPGGRRPLQTQLVQCAALAALAQRGAALASARHRRPSTRRNWREMTARRPRFIKILSSPL